MMIPDHLRPVDFPIAPAQKPGFVTGFTGLRVHFSSEAEAHQAYEGALERFQNPLRWFQQPPVADRMKLHYNLVDGTNTPITGRGPAIGDYGRVQVGASKTADWVHIENVGSGPDMVSFTFRPTGSPISSAPGETSHFYTHDATNTMTIWRDQKDLVSTVQIRNVRGNTLAPEMPDAARRLRNHAYWIGSELGGQKYMWTTWVGESSLAGIRATGKGQGYLWRPRNTEGLTSYIPELYAHGAKAALTSAREGVSNLMKLVH
ncbi:MAG: hypothetical protein H7123_02325 [Thermoleophilia bacterium]|nr:hypothetical protein [Thermoleophilia bacterium]